MSRMKNNCTRSCCCQTPATSNAIVRCRESFVPRSMGDGCFTASERQGALCGNIVVVCRADGI